MNMIAPVGKVYQAGTLSGNPLAMRAGYTMLKTLNEKPEIYDQLEATTAKLETGLLEIFSRKKIPVTINRAASMISVHFSDHPVVDFKSASAANNDLFKKYFHASLSEGVYLPPSPFETWFVSTAIGEKELNHTFSVTEKFLSGL
jgi:glutamate-1-semialdehyde 2,1-aminomutase